LGLNHPNRYDKVLAVDCGQLGSHTEDCSVSTGNGCFIQMRESPDQLIVGIDRALDFQRMQPAIVLDDHVDLVTVAISIIPQQTFLGIVTKATM